MSGGKSAKKILWVCNTPLQEIQNNVGIKSYQEGGGGISSQLRVRNDIDSYYAPQRRFKRGLQKTINRINFLGFYDLRESTFDLRQESIELACTLVKEIKPDIIHIFGT